MSFTVRFVLASRRLPTALAGVLLVLGTLAPFSTASAFAAGSVPVVSSDVKIQSMSVTSTTSVAALTTLTQIVIQNDNDDDARNVQLIVTLPPTSHLISASPNAVPGFAYPDPSSQWQVVGSVVFAWPTIGVGKTTLVWLTTEMLAAEVTPTTSVGAFVFGSLPDPNGTNNFRSLPVRPS